MKIYFLILIGCLFSLDGLLAKERLPHVIYASPKGGRTIFKGKTIRAHTLETAFRKARGGSLIHLLPGTYTKHYEFSQEGAFNEPVTIRGMADLTSFACGRSPITIGKPALRITVSKWIIFENIVFKDCWPTAIEITDSEFITIRNTKIIRAHTGIRIRHRGTHHVLVENNHFEGPPEPGDVSANFVTTDSMSGDLILRDNVVVNANIGAMLRSSTPLFNIVIANNIFRNTRGDVFDIGGEINNLHITKNNLEGSAAKVRIEELRGNQLVSDIKELGFKLTPQVYGDSEAPHQTPVRIIKVHYKEKHIEVDFSQPVELLKGALTLVDEEVIHPKDCKSKDRTIRCRFERPPKPDSLVRLSSKLRSRSGARLTNWAKANSANLEIFEASEKSGLF